jgi:hypothetical protein
MNMLSAYLVCGFGFWLDTLNKILLKMYLYVEKSKCFF